MAIVSIDRHWIGQVARRETNGAQTITTRYQVICDAIETDTDLQILEDSRIPTTGDSITLRGITYYVQSIATEPPDDNNRIIWHVTVDWTDTLNGGGDLDQPPGGQKPNPVDDDPTEDFDSGDGVKFVNRDIDGKLITNTAGDPPEPKQVFDPHPVVNYGRNEASFTWATARKYVNHVNKTVWNGAPVGTVLCRRIRAQKRWRSSIPYWSVTYQFEFSEDGWQYKLTSLGLRELVSSTSGGTTTTTLTPIYVNGEPTQEPMPLDFQGQYTPSADVADTTEWKVVREEDFGPLNITLAT